MPVRVRPLARLDLGSIWRHVAEDNPAAADALVARITACFERLAEMPGMGIPTDRLERGLRRMPLDRYMIFYETADDGVVIERVLHGARDLDRLLRR